MMSTIELGSSSGLRSIKARSGIAARSSARIVFSDPFPARPMGVRMASTITASGMAGGLLGRLARRAVGCSAYAVIAPKRHQIAVEPLAERNDVRLEATAQLRLQALVERRRGNVEHAACDGVQARRHGCVEHAQQLARGVGASSRALDGPRE